MTDVEKRAVIDSYIDAYNDLDVDGMMRTLHPSITFENIEAGVVNASASGARAFRELAEQATEWFSSRRQTITAFRGYDGGATIDIAYEGTLAADLPNGQKAGETIELTGRSEFEFIDGQIASIRDIH